MLAEVTAELTVVTKLLLWVEAKVCEIYGLGVSKS